MASMISSLIERLVNDDCLLMIFAFAASGLDVATLFALSQVSQRWRNLAIADSSLWTQIFVDEDSINYYQRVRGTTKIPRPFRIFPRISLMLRRSRQRLLSITIDISISESGHSAFHSRIDFLASLITPHRERVAHFHTKSAFWMHHAILTDIFTGISFPLLQSLFIECSFKSIGQEFEENFPPDTISEKLALTPFVDAEDSIAASFPNLREMSFLGTVCDWARYPGHNLSTITIAGIPLRARPSTAQLCSLLAMSKDTLTALQINGALPYDDGDDDIVDVELPRLDTLSLLYTTVCELIVFVDHVRVPALRKLEIENLNPDLPVWPHDIEVHADTMDAFESITRCLPLEQIKDLRLANMRLGPAPVKFPMKGAKGMDHLPAPFQFMQRLRNAQVVRFDNPDRYLLWTASYPLAGRPQDDVVMPAVQKVVMTAGSHAAAIDVKVCLSYRCAEKVRRWPEMELSLPRSAKDEFRVFSEYMDVSEWSQVVFRHATNPDEDEWLEYGPNKMDVDD